MSLVSFSSGAPRPAGQKKDVTYEKCHALIKRYTQKTLDFEPKHAPRGNVAAMSYFYDVAADAGIIGKNLLSYHHHRHIGICHPSSTGYIYQVIGPGTFNTVSADVTSLLRLRCAGKITIREEPECP